MSNRRTGDAHQQPEAAQSASVEESSAIGADLPIQERIKARLQLVPQGRLADIVSALLEHDNADVRHATYDAIDAVSG